MTSRGRPGPIQRDIDIELLSLVSSGCTVEQIVQELGLSLWEVHGRLVALRHVIEDLSSVTSSH